MPMNEPRKDEGEDRFEQHLREFQPVVPRALAIPSRRAPWGVLAAAAGVLLVIALSLVLKGNRSPDKTAAARRPELTVPHASVAIPVTLGTLNTALRTNDQELNKMLDDVSPRLLPREHRGTALFELGKE
jgi:hypothetical protein